MSKEEELITDLEIYVDCLTETTEKFKSLKNPSYMEREEFFNEYISLEDDILATIEKIKSENEKLENLIEQFNKSWNCYQDTWSEEYWEQYEYLRKSRDKTLGLVNTVGIAGNSNNINEINGLSQSNIEFNLNKSEINRKQNFNLVSQSMRKEETFGKIDEELNNIDDSKITTDKKRGCTDCIIF